MSSLFDTRDRSDPSPARHAERVFDFLNRVDDPVFERERQLLDGWFAYYPANDPADEQARNELRSRFRSGDDIDFNSAFWELYLHEVHRRVGYHVTVHPETDKGTHPDFYFQRGQEAFYLEAKLAVGTALTGVADQPGLDDVFDKINDAYDPDFYVAVEDVIAGPEAPSRSALTRPIEAWLNSLDWADVWQRCVEGQEDYPTTTVVARGWTIRLRAHPRPNNRRGDPSFRTIAIYPGVGGISLAAEMLTDRLEQKARRYGRLGAPYVLALWSLAAPTGEDDFEYALFGHEGLWRSGGAAARVSAVLGAYSWTFGGPHSVAATWPTLWVNPSAESPLDASGLPWPTKVGNLDTGDVRSASAPQTPAQFFGLGAQWPGTPFAGLN